MTAVANSEANTTWHHNLQLWQHRFMELSSLRQHSCKRSFSSESTLHGAFSNSLLCYDGGCHFLAKLQIGNFIFTMQLILVMIIFFGIPGSISYFCERFHFSLYFWPSFSLTSHDTSGQNRCSSSTGVEPSSLVFHVSLFLIWFWLWLLELFCHFP